MNITVEQANYNRGQCRADYDSVNLILVLDCNI